MTVQTNLSIIFTIVLALLFCIGVILQSIPDNKKPIKRSVELTAVYPTEILSHRMSIVQIQSTEISRNPMGYRYELYYYDANNKQTFLTYSDVMQTLKSDTDGELTDLFTSIFRSPQLASFTALFWECKPVTKANFASQPFEFVVLNSPTLATRRVDSSSFQEQFDHFTYPTTNGVIAFQNLGKDATLVVPCPSEGTGNNKVATNNGGEYPQYMTHLASFLRFASVEHSQQLWRTIAMTMIQLLDREEDLYRKYWLSTSGLGVSWLHVRIDSNPKYYNWIEYKQG